MDAAGMGEGWVEERPNELSGEPPWIERLFVHGASTLSDAELSLVLTGRRTALQLDGGLRALRQAEPYALARKLGPRAAARLCAALELARRTVDAGPRPSLSTPQAIYEHLRPKLAGEPRETFCVLCLDPRNQLLREALAMVGAADSCPVDPREVFAPAVACRATAVVLAHNHPSGDPEPSVQDVVLTRRLMQGGALLGVQVLDHLVLSERGYVSMMARGFIDERAALARGGRDAG